MYFFNIMETKNGDLDFLIVGWEFGVLYKLVSQIA